MIREFFERRYTAQAKARLDLRAKQDTERFQKTQVSLGSVLMRLKASEHWEDDDGGAQERVPGL